MMTNSQFNKAKADLSGKDPLIKRVRLSDIALDDNSIKNGTVKVGDSVVPVSQKFFNRLGQAVNLAPGLLTRMNKNGDNDVQTKLLKAVKHYSQSREGNSEFLLVGDSTKKEVGDIVKSNRYNRLSNETLFNTAETIMNEVPDMHIQSVDSFDGQLSINLIHGSQSEYSRLGPDETFRFGISLVNGNVSSRVDDFFYRLSCENGAMAKNLSTAFEFGHGADSFRALLEEMHGWAKTGFVPKIFAQRLETAMQTKASLFEMRKAYNTVAGQIRNPDHEQKARLEAALRQQHFPHLAETSARIVRAGRDPLSLTDDQMKFVKTGMSVWDLVNELTWLGSHETAFDLRSNSALKKTGGDLFTKTWDLEHAGLASI